MKFSKRVLLLLCISLLLSSRVSATHIVGGVIYYENLGNGKYKLIFEIYKDCGPGVKVGFDGTKSSNPNIQLPKFYFSVFKGNVNTNIARPFNELDLIDTIIIQPVIVNPCLKVDKNTCVVKGRYETEIQLPNNSEGYTIQYMRCCRNDGIVNIQNQPGSSDKPGITLRTYIPPYGLTPNNSARFKNFPPIFICVNQQFYFDHSATDIDGDELRYSLTNPLEGLSSDKPTDINQTLNVNPTFWSGGYGLNNVIGGNPPMTIDSVSGLLVCKPSNVGRYVVSILVKEIRNGVVIDSFARDFQYNVVDCDIPNADLSFLPNTYDPVKDIGVYINCGELSLTFDNTSTNATRYEWNFGDPRSGANNTSTAVTPTHVFSDTGVYILTLIAYKTQASGQLCIDSTRRICRIYPKIKTLFTFTSDCENKLIQFTDLTQSASGKIVKWDWTFGDGKKATIQNANNMYTSAGNYKVNLKITNSNNCISDTNLPITIYPRPVINAIVPKGCISYPMDLKCLITIPSPYTIQSNVWTLPSGTKYNTCNFTYTPTSTTSSTVKLWAISDKGCIDSANFNFIVNPLPKITASPDMTICYDKTAQLTASGGISYEWSPATYLSDIAISNPIASPPYPTPMTYIVKGTDANTCYNFDTVNLNFFIKPFIDAGPDTSICLNTNSSKFKTNVQLTGKGVFNSIFWTPITGLNNPNLATPIAQPITNTDYVFNGIDVNNCLIRDTVRVTVLDPNIDILKLKDTFICSGDSLMLIAEDQGIVSSYTWTPNFWLSNNMIRNPIARPLDTIVYTLTIENYCYIKSDKVTVNVNALPDPELISLDSVCLGSIYQFITKPGFVSYNWTTTEPTFTNKIISNPKASPSYTQNYTLQVTDKYGCKNTDSIELRVHYPPNLYVDGLPKYLCYGDSVPLTAIAGIRSNYLWKDKRYLSSDTARTVLAFPPDTAFYSVTATSYQKCSTTVNFRINVQKPIQPYAIRPVRICKGKFITLHAEGGLYYLWSPVYNINDTIVPNPQVSPDSTFTYQVKISNDCFIDSILVDVYVDSLPVVDAGKDTSIYRGQEIKLIAKTNAEMIEWMPKELINSNIFNYEINVSPIDSTLYYVQATNGRGCIGRDIVYVYVYGKNVLLIPTGFSPNKDGINDVFHVAKYLNIKKLNYFEVYNRWGEKVYSSIDITKGWDGTYNGQSAPAGVYVWEIEAVNYEKQRINKSGNVTLIR
jgi:gliding motility-associated-like protein